MNPLLVILMLAALATPAMSDPLAILPPDQVVRHTLENLPQLRASAMNIDLARSGKSRLEAGNHEWTVRVGSNRRTDQAGGRFNEQELALERPVRWFGKAEKDIALGDKGILVAEASHADTWHEAGRALMKDWFDALRELAATRRLEEQVALAGQLRSIADKRLRAGDAAQLELLQADTESRRVTALLQQSQLRQELALQLLAASYPGLPQPNATQLPLPTMPTESTDYWLGQITGDNHELELAQAEAELLALQAARVASERMPDPTIGIRAGRERDGQERLAGISIAIALPGSARNAERSGAALKAGMAMQRSDQTRMKVIATARRVITDSQRSYTIWQTMQRIADQSQQQAGTMMSAYTLGEASLADALATRRQALDAAVLAEAAQIDALAAAARLQLDAHRLWAMD